MDRTNHNIQDDLQAENRQFYISYKDRLNLLGRIEDLQRITLPNLRSHHEKQSKLVQMGRGNPQKVADLEQELRAAENDILFLQSRLKALENYD